jgi:small conductance mechanosensitive channel
MLQAAAPEAVTETAVSAINQGQVWFDQGVELASEFGPRVIGVIFIFILAKWFGGHFGRLTAAAVKKAGLDEMLANFGGSIVKYLILVVAVLAALGMFGIQTTSFVAVLGALGFAFGLALQGTLSNFSSGVMLLFFRPFAKGDLVEAGGVVGTVEDLGLFGTTLITPENLVYTVPNGQIYGSVIKNMTAKPLRRIGIMVGVAYDADIDEAKRILIAAAASVDLLVAEPAPEAYLTELGGSSVDFEVRGWADPAKYWAVREALTRAAKLALDEAGISIPFPQLDLHVQQLPPTDK